MLSYHKPQKCQGKIFLISYHGAGVKYYTSVCNIANLVIQVVSLNMSSIWKIYVSSASKIYLTYARFIPVYLSPSVYIFTIVDNKMYCCNTNLIKQLQGYLFPEIILQNLYPPLFQYQVAKLFMCQRPYVCISIYFQNTIILYFYCIFNK